MTTATESFPVDELREQAATARPGRVLVTMVSWVLAAIGWIAGRSLVILGWIAGRTWLALAYMAEAVVFGFRNGAGLPLRGVPEKQPPAR